MKKIIINNFYLTKAEKIGSGDFVNKIQAQYKDNLLMVKKMIGSKLSKNFDKESDIDLLFL